MAELVSNLRLTIASKTKDTTDLQQKVVEIDSERSAEVSSVSEHATNAKCAQRRAFQEEKTRLEKDLQEAKESLLDAQKRTQDQLSQNEEQLSTLNSQLVVAKAEIEKLKQKDSSPVLPPAGEDSSAKDAEIAQLKRELEEAQTKVAESEKEQEDLLVLLEEVMSKRKADKVKMRQAGMEVSEDEEEEGEDDE
jgi:hypothetical protein